MRRCGEMRVVRTEERLVLVVARDFLAMVLCLGFLVSLLFFMGGR